MGACCTKDYMYGGGGGGGGKMTYDMDERDSTNGGEEGEEIRRGEDGAMVRIRGSSLFTSMFTQRGRKGINQDAMTVWEDFTGKKDLVFCGVFDGHGPSGHKAARQARDLLPLKLSKAIKKQLSRVENGVSEASYVDEQPNNKRNPLVSKWEAAFEESYKEFDEALSLDSSIDCFCSGTTAVTIIKQGEHLVIANVGDSRAVLRCRLPWPRHVKILRRFLPQGLRPHLNSTSLLQKTHKKRRIHGPSNRWDMGCINEQTSNQHSSISKEPIHGGEIGGETSSSRMETPISRVDGRRLCSDLLVLQESTIADEINDERGAAEPEKSSRTHNFKEL